MDTSKGPARASSVSGARWQPSPRNPDRVRPMRLAAAALLVALPAAANAAEGGHCTCDPDARPTCTVTDLVASEPGMRCDAVDNGGALALAVEIRDTKDLEAIDLTGLNSTRRGVRVSFNEGLHTLLLPTLEDAGGDVRIDFNPKLKSVRAPVAATCKSPAVAATAKVCALYWLMWCTCCERMSA